MAADDRSGARASIGRAPRAFRPRGWAVLLTLVIVAATIRLGNWQGTRAAAREQQQAAQQRALQLPALAPAELLAMTELDDNVRYRTAKLDVRFVADAVLFADNRMHDGRVGYGVLQLVVTALPTGGVRYFLLDRGWVEASPFRDQLPNVSTPDGVVSIEARVDRPPSRNRGSADNDGAKVLNYVDIGEIARRWQRPLAPFELDQIGGAGFTGVSRPLGGTNAMFNRILQAQWYLFAALAVVLFVVLNFRKRASS